MSAVAKLLHDKLIPWSQNSLHQRCIVARDEMVVQDMPDGVELEPSPIPGKRVIFRAERQYANTRVQIAEWPEAGLLETNNMRLACVATGRAAYQVHHYRLHAPAGHFIFMPPGTPHPIGYHPHLVDNSGFCELVNLQLYRGAVQCWLCCSENNLHYGPQLENYLLTNDKVVRLFEMMMEEVIEGGAQTRALSEHLMASFLIVLLRELEAGRYSHPCAKNTYEMPIRSSGDFASQLRDYVQTHLNESLTVEEAARQMHLSRTHFSRLIKRETGKTFVEVLTEVRIAAAKTLLTESDWTSAAVAEFVGFKSATYFNSLFLEQTGQTPGKFRQSSRTSAAQKQGAK